MIYIVLALVSAFSAGVYIGWSAAMVAFIHSVKRGTMRQILDDYEDAFGRGGND